MLQQYKKIMVAVDGSDEVNRVVLFYCRTLCGKRELFTALVQQFFLQSGY